VGETGIMRIAALPLINAIRAVCASKAGIRTYNDLPVMSGAVGSCIMKMIHMKTCGSKLHTRSDTSHN
jgi:hypothetical protein